MSVMPRKKPRIDIIYNTRSGCEDQDKYLNTLVEQLGEKFEQVVVHRCEQESPFKTAEEALKDGAKLLVAVGGDGTVTALASAIRGRENVSLAIAPRGTANATSVALGIPSAAKDAAKLAATGHKRVIDLPHVRAQGFEGEMLLLTGVGFEARVVKATKRSLKKMVGGLAYALTGLSLFKDQRPFRAHITLHGVKDKFHYANGEIQAESITFRNMKLRALTVANAAPPTSVLAQGIGYVRPDDGLVEVVCVAPKSVLGLFTAMVNMLRAALFNIRLTRPDVFGLRASRVLIECDPPQRIVVDGEEAGTTPLEVQLGDPSSKVSIIAPKAGTLHRRQRKFQRSLGRLWRNLRGLGIFSLAIFVLRKTRRTIDDDDSLDLDKLTL